MKRKTIQEKAVKALVDAGFNGTVVLTMGTGKTKVAIDAMQLSGARKVMVIVPRVTLLDTWDSELRKWRGTVGQEVHWTTMQWVYHNLNVLDNMDLLIVDEIHTIGEKFFKILEYKPGLKIIGLTGTPDKNKEFKANVLYQRVPIVMEYHDSARDKLINKQKVYIYEYKLNNNDKVAVGPRNKTWLAGEAVQYNYLTMQYENAKTMMFNQGASDYWLTSIKWMHSSDPARKQAGTAFFRAVKNRKDFLFSLSSSANIAIELKKKILGKYTNKVLLFSELTAQANRLSPHTVHSKTGKSTKETNLMNKKTIERFNHGLIREISSCASLTLGLNLTGANWAIFESYNSSDTIANQKKGRLSRLAVEDVANVVIIVPAGTQAESWFQSAFSDVIEDATVITSVEELPV